MAEGDPDFLVVGHLNRVHGIEGEIYVWPLTDHPESTFRPGITFRVSDATGDRPSDLFPSLEIESVRAYKRGFLVKFVGLADRTEAERFRGRYLMRPFDEAEELGEGEVFYHQLLGMEVETAEGEALGTIQEVYEVGAADLVEIRGPRGVLHIPFTESVVDELDVEGARMVVDPPEGMLDQ